MYIDDKNNRILANDMDCSLCNMKQVVFNGHNNTLICDKLSNIFFSKISFLGDNSIIYIDKTNKKYNLHIRICTDCLLYVGKNCFFNSFNNQPAIFFIYEHSKIIIGNGCIISFGVQFRTADTHLIYDILSGKRINNSKSILLGDHVWVGQNALIMKGSYIGSGAIVGARAVVSGKRIPSNQAWAGNPVRLVRKDVFWERPSTNNYDLESTNRNLYSPNKKFIFDYCNSNLVDRIDSISLNEILSNKDINRFSIPMQ